MEYPSSIPGRFILKVGLWILSLFCELPFFLGVGLLSGLLPSMGSKFGLDQMGMVFLIAVTSLACRFFSLHLVGSWVLKWVLIRRGVGALWLSLAEFVLANLWVGAWAVILPNSIASMLFRPEHSADHSFQLTLYWYVSIPPIALGSFLFRRVFGRFMTPASEGTFSGQFVRKEIA